MKMNKAQSALIGTLIMIMIGSIVAIAVVIPVIQTQLTSSQTTYTATDTNTSSGIVMTNGKTYTLSRSNNPTGYVIGSLTVVNSTGGQSIGASNYAFDNNLGIVTWATTYPAGSTRANITYTYGASGYISNPTVSSLLNIIPIFLVLLIVIAVVALIKF